MRWMIVLLVALAVALPTLYLRSHPLGAHSAAGNSPAGNSASGNLAGNGVSARSKADPGRGPRIFAGGIVEGSHPEILLRFEVPGRIKSVNVREGDSVKPGDVLAELETDLGELAASAAYIQWRLALAERDLLTARQPRSQFSKEEETIADAKIALAENAANRENALLQKTRLRSPIEGTVLRARPALGELVGPVDERESFAVVNRQIIRVRAFVEELDATRVAPGQEAIVSVPGKNGQSYRGVVTSCAPGVGPKWHRHLKPGERLDVRVREVVIQLDGGADLLIGLPVEVLMASEVPPGISLQKSTSGR